VTGWKLFTGEPPEPVSVLAGRGAMDLENQPGFAQRAAMVAKLVTLIAGLRPDIATVTDLGCGDGSLFGHLPPHLTVWGYEIGAGDVVAGCSRGLDVRHADILCDPLGYGDLLIASEVLEHLADPAAFLKGLPDRVLVVSSPSAETRQWHNPIHAWAWDLAGYRDLVESAGWRVLYQTECDGGRNEFAGVTGAQRFQAITAARGPR
jgi:Methyltransferase domain